MFLRNFLIILIIIITSLKVDAASKTILNVSYDPTRELYKEINQEYAKINSNLIIKQSHGGSGKQTNAVINGLKADVVTLATPFDVDVIAEKGLLDKNWGKKFPHESSPYNSLIVLVVRKGNPKNIQDWDDLVKNGVSVITPNPKTSGGAIWNYLAAYSYALKKYNSELQAIKFITNLYKNVPILDTSARNATISFTKRKLGDVLISWENEALLVTKKLNPNEYQIIYPSTTILANLPVAVIDKVVSKNNTQQEASSYLNFLFSKNGQKIIGKHFFRPIEESIITEFDYFNIPNSTRILTLKDIGKWSDIKAKHFDSNGIFDKIYEEH